MTTTRLFPLGLMLALALLTFYLERTVREDDAPQISYSEVTITQWEPEERKY